MLPTTIAKAVTPGGRWIWFVLLALLPASPLFAQTFRITQVQVEQSRIVFNYPAAPDFYYVLYQGSDPGAVAGEDRRRDRLDREEAVLDVDQDEVEARERGELDDARDGPGEEAAEESLARAHSRA